MARAFRIGDKVECIKQPSPGHYQCKLGEILVIAKFIDGGANLVREGIPKGTYGECFDVRGFKLSNAINPQDFYNKY